MNCSLPGFPDLHYLPEFVHTQVHWAGDAIQPSHPLSLPSPPALNLSQHQGLSDEPSLPTRWPKRWSFSFSISPSVSASVLPVNIQGWFPLGMTGLTSLLSKDSDEPSTSQFESINSSIVSFPYGPTLRTKLLEKMCLWLYGSFSVKWYLCFLIYCLGEGNGTPLQYFCLENPMDGGAW